MEEINKSRSLKELLTALRDRINVKCYDSFSYHIEQMRRRNKISRYEYYVLIGYVAVMAKDEHNIRLTEWLTRIEILDKLIDEL